MYLQRFLHIRSCYGQLVSYYKHNKCKLIPNKYYIEQLKHILSRHNSTNTSEISKVNLLNSKSSNLEKDKILFYYENPTFFKVLNAFGFIQFFFWLHLSEFTYSRMKDIKMRETEFLKKLPTWQQIDFQNKTTRISVSVFCFLLGYGVLACAWIYTLKSVRMLVLKKGGKTVSIVSYGPFGKNRYLDVPLEKLSTDQSRITAKSTLPLKVQGKWFYYLLDTKNGTFRNPELFDFTAGMKRIFKK